MAGSPASALLLFDLDGTLTDPFVGITRSIGHAMERMGRLVPDPETLRWCIGPPLKNAFRVLLDTDDGAMIDTAVGFYRERYSAVGKFENVMIEGMSQALDELRDASFDMVVATSKLESYAKDIVDHFGLRPYFSAVHGSRHDGSNSAKSDLIGHILTGSMVGPKRSLMIGDRSHDMVGAAANGVAGVGVLWGFGDHDELTTAGAAAVAAAPHELPDIIRRLLADTHH